MSNPTRHSGDLADRLRRARLLAGLEQAQLAAAMGVARTSISNYECGRTTPSAATFIHWAQATGTPLDWLAQGVPAIHDNSTPTLDLPR
jgi:transcriptional regulator with XRE-family HTH domain